MSLLFDQNLSRRLVGLLAVEYSGSEHVESAGLLGADERFCRCLGQFRWWSCRLLVERDRSSTPVRLISLENRSLDDPTEMKNIVRVVGVHPVPADEPVHLIEIELSGDIEAFDFGEITQALPDQRRENWQAAYDERELQRNLKSARFAFFFHYLDLRKALLTSWGPVNLPAESPAPKHLASIEYEQP
jgi:hypothetical protein